MTTKLSELRTYYQRNWEAALPKLPSWETVGHVAGLALPFVGLLCKTAGTAISFGSTSLNVIATGLELREAKTWTKVHAWSVIKNGAEFIGTIASLRIGLAVHSVMNLGENTYTFVTKFKKLTWSQTGERMLPIVSNALYLLTLVNFSTPVGYGVIGASLVFQASWSLYKARNAYKEAKTWKDIKILDAAAHTAMSVIFMTKAKTAIEQCRKILNAVQRTFVLMRPASKHSKESPTGGLSEKGKTLAQTKMPVALNQIAKENGKTSLVFFTSPAAHHLETAKLVAQKQDNTRGTVIDALHEAKKPVISRKDQVGGYIPPHALVKTRTLPLEEKWAILERRWVESGQAAQGIESPAQVGARVDGAIRQVLDLQPEGSDLPVIVTGGTNMTRFIEGEVLKNPNIPEKAARSIKDGGIRVVTMTPDEMGDLHVTQVIAVDPKKIAMPA
jgi:broad specificity phosphatase PhoE